MTEFLLLMMYFVGFALIAFGQYKLLKMRRY